MWMKHCFIAQFERGEILGEAPSTPCTRPVSPPANPSTSRVMMHLALLVHVTKGGLDMRGGESP